MWKGRQKRKREKERDYVCACACICVHFLLRDQRRYNFIFFLFVLFDGDFVTVDATIVMLRLLLPITDTVRSVRGLCWSATDIVFILVLLIFLSAPYIYIIRYATKVYFIVDRFFLLSSLCSHPPFSCCYLSHCLPFSLSIWKNHSDCCTMKHCIP